jgi:hypothetical protein
MEVLSCHRNICLNNSQFLKLKYNKYVSFYNMDVKDIVQPKKRGVKRGTNRFGSTSYTIADVF